MTSPSAVPGPPPGAASVARSAAVVSGFTMLSRVLGLVREILMAALFGTSLAKSAFDIAFTIPNLFRRLFGEGALSAAFVPVFTATLRKDGLARAGALAGRMAVGLAAVLGVVVVAGLIAIGAALEGAALSAKADLVLRLLRVMLPYTVCICLVALCMGVLNARGHFAAPAATPIVLNVVWIATLVLACRHVAEPRRIYVIAWAVLVAGVLQLAAQAPFLRHCGIRLRFGSPWRDGRVREVIALMGPAALGMGLFQLNTVVDRLLAMAVADWAPAAMVYAERLVYLPLGIIATALATVLLPTFSHQAADDAAAGSSPTAAMSATLTHSLRNLLFIMTPAALGLLVLAEPIVRLVFESGQFGPMSTTYTTRALVFYAPGLIVFSLPKALVPAFYAVRDTRTPVRVGLCMVGLNLFLNILFILTWPVGYKHAGLACASVVASGVNAALLAALLRRRFVELDFSPVWRSFVRTGVAAVGMAAVAPALCRALAAALAGLPEKPAQLLSVGLAIALSAAIYVGLAALLRCPELREFLAARRRSSKSPESN